MQETLTQELHQQARVPEGPCSLGELKLFQIMLSDYQIIVVSVDHGYQIIYKGPSQPEDKELILIKVGDHYHACSSLAGFPGKGYYCVECERAFSDDGLAHHRCNGKKSFACHQYNCEDFKNTNSEQAHLPCQKCNRFFFGPICQTNHMLYKSEGKVAASTKTKNSVCDAHKRCVHCYKVYTPYEIQKQMQCCGYARCPCCYEYLNLYQHQCYLQNPDELNKKKTRKSRKQKQGSAAGLATLRANEEGEEEEEEEVLLPSPCFVYFDIEARREYGDDPEVERPIIAVAHNFQGYDSYFILDEFYKQGICPDQVVNGAKILCMSKHRLKFIDSMSFLQMALSGFSKAFGLNELKKGFCPHFFNTVDNHLTNYVGPIPAQDYYDLQSMSIE